jgi:hypothetical protein
MHLRIPLAFVALLACNSAAPAQEFTPIWGIRHVKPPELWTIDLKTGKATFVSRNMTQTKVACARHPRTGLLWLFSNVTPNKISVWDPATDTETTVHSGPGVQFHRVGFDADCRLYGVPLNSNVLFEIDTTSGALTQLGGMSGVDTAGDGGDLCFAPGVTGTITYFAGAKYYSVDLASLQGTLVKDGVGFKSTGAAYTADGRLWVTSDSDLYECDPATGDATLVGGFGMKQVLDITEDLSPMYFGADPLDPAAGETIDLFTREGGPGAAMLLALTELNGSSTFVSLGVFTFDATCQWAVSDTVPPGLSGVVAEFTCFGFAKSGDLLVTNPQTIAFQ